MARLPDTTGLADEVVMPRTHRTAYDQAIRGAGARVVDVGTNDRHLGTGAADVEPWELAAAIGEDTAAVGYVQKEYTTPDLATVADVAHEAGVPVVVDAAAELPPVENLSRFLEAGADLVAFSGGKAVRGPQTTGFLVGRADLVASAAAQHLDSHAAAGAWDPPGAFGLDRYDGVPRQGVGRPMKVGKEELVGAIRALELFLAEDHDARRAAWRDRAAEVAAALDQLPGLAASVSEGPESVSPWTDVTVDPAAAGVTALELVRSLRAERPRVFVGADDAADGRFTVNPMCLTDEEAAYVVERIEATL
jgi:L-seryl-tRNA(Ser) seleniumtransferase